MPNFNDSYDRLSERIGRRKKQRLKTNFEIQWYFEDNPEALIDGEVVNISSDGACILRKTIINTNDIIHLIFNFNGEKIDIKSKVINIVGREVALEFDASEDVKLSLVRAFNEELHREKSAINIMTDKESFLKKLE